MAKRFAFGQNWQRFLRHLSESQILEAQDSLRQALGVDSLRHQTFLDVGSGSGLFSLAAVRLGAERVHSFDYDRESVACTAALKQRYCANPDGWHVERGDVLGEAYLNTLGQFDVVYAWGVLHHTGQMWRAMANVARLVRDDGQLYLAIYNDQGMLSASWRAIKRTYTTAPRGVKLAMEVGCAAAFSGGALMVDVLARRNPLARYLGRQRRGMDFFVDVVDWIGGYPFEVATPDAVFQFYRDRGFALQHLRTCGGKLGCNEFVFRKLAAGSPP